MSQRKTLLVAALVMASASLLGGCRSMSSGGQGALIGGLLGAGAGHAVGHHRGNRTNYALAGGVAGALAGYIIGDAVGDNDRANRAGPETIGGTDDRYGYEDRRTTRVVRRRVYYEAPADEPCCDDPRW